MGATYTRQSTYADGDTITAAHTNDEFDQLLAAFASSSGHTHDGTAAEGGPITSLLGNTLTFGAATAGTDITITFDGETNDGVLKWMEDEDYFEFSDDILVASTEKLQFRDTAIYINSSTDGQLDLVADTEIQIAATTIDINGAVVASGEIAAASLDISGDIDVDGTSNLDIVDIDGAVNIAAEVTIASTNKILFNDSSQFIQGSSATVLSIAATDEIDLTATSIDINGAVDVSSTLATGGLYTAGAGITSTASANTLGATSFNDADITNVGSIALDTITSDATDITVDAAGDIILDAGGANVLIKDDGTTVLDINNSSSDVNLTVSVADKNFAIKGTDGSSAITALDIDMALAGKATFSGDVVVTGDLTISGDDLVMGTNTDSMLLIADGTNFNPTAVSSLSEISTAANDDVFLAIDTSGGGLKKITRSTVLAGTGSSDDLANVVEDTTPQLGGNLDTNSHNILIDDAHFIGDESGNEQIIFQTTGSAVNQFDVTNAASGSGPQLSATGSDSNIDLNLLAKGTGHVTVKGNTNSGAIQFNCESNSHGQILIAQPHSAAVTNTLTLPAGASSTLVSLVSTDTLTNKTFGDNTSFGDNNITNVGDIALDSISADGTDINVAVSDNSATAFTIKQGSDAYLIIDTGNSSESVSIGTGISGTAITLGHSTSEVTVADNLTVAGNFTVSGTSTTVDTTNLTVTDPLVKYGQGSTGTSVDQGFIVTRGDGSSSNTANRGFIWDESADEFATIAANTEDGSTAGNVTINDYAPLHVGAITADDNSTFSGNIDVDGTANLDVVDIDGAVDMATTLTLAGNADFNGDLDVDGTTNLDVVDIDGAVDMASTLTVNDSVTFVSSGASKPVLTIKNTNADANPPSITFQKDSSSPADNDEVANINFYGDDDGGAVAAYANLKVVSTDVSNGSEDGKMTIRTMTAGTLTDTLVLESGATTVSGTLTAGGTAVFTNLDISGDVDVDGTLETDALTVAGVAAKVAGKETIWVPASAMQPTTSNGCSALTTVETTSGRPDMVVLDFDKDSDEFAQFSVAFPKSWNEGTVTFQYFWSGLAATTGVTLGLQGVAVGDNDTIDVAYGTAVLVDDDAQGAVEEMLVSAESGAITIAGSPAVDQLCYFRVFRDVSASNDDMAGDCRLHGIKVFFTTDAANDA